MTFAAIEERRLKLGLSIDALLAAAGFSRSFYYRLDALPAERRRVALARLRIAMSRLAGKPQDLAVSENRLTLYTYLAVLALVCREKGVDPALVQANDPARKATADPDWLLAAQMRRLALYLANCGLGLNQAPLAKATGLTPAAVSLAIQKLEARRDTDADLDRWLDAMTEALGGGAT